MKLYMFRTVRLSIIGSLFTVHSAMVYAIPVCIQLSSRTIRSCSKTVYKPVWHIQLLSVQWIQFWRWTDELSETCRISWHNKYVKLVRLVGFVTKKFVTMHGNMNLKFSDTSFAKIEHHFCQPLDPNLRRFKWCTSLQSALLGSTVKAIYSCSF
jgi:hypothetical protein